MRGGMPILVAPIKTKMPRNVGGGASFGDRSFRGLGGPSQRGDRTSVGWRLMLASAAGGPNPLHGMAYNAGGGGGAYTPTTRGD